jgi:hypothetical protein
LDVQTFFPGNRSRYCLCFMILMGRYFPVYGTDEIQPVTVVDQLILSCIEQTEAEDREYQQGINEVKDMISPVTKTPWLRHTKLEERFMGHDMKVLHDMTNPPETRDYAARRVWDTTGRILARCWDGFHDVLERGWELLPYWIASATREAHVHFEAMSPVHSTTILQLLAKLCVVLSTCI